MNGHGSLQQVLNIICNVFDAYSTALFLPRGESQNGSESFILSKHFSLGDKIVDNAVIAPGEGIVGWIIRSRQPLLINNFDQKRGFLGYYSANEEASVRAFMGCPLDKGMGALCLDSKRTFSFSSKDQKILHQFAQLIGHMHSERERLEYDARQFHYYAALQRIVSLGNSNGRWSDYLSNLLNLLSMTANMDYCIFAARDEKGKNYFIEGSNQPIFKGESDRTLSFNINSGAIGYVFKKHTQLISGEEGGSAAPSLFGKEFKTPPFQTLVCLPLIVNRLTRGVLVLADERPLPVPQDLQVFLGMASDNLSLFLENLYWKNRLTTTTTT